MMDRYPIYIFLFSDESYILLNPLPEQKGAAGTANLLAKRGRSRYLGERVIGHIDPGTYSQSSLIISILLQTLYICRCNFNQLLSIRINVNIYLTFYLIYRSTK